jgi:alpha-glucosidase
VAEPEAAPWWQAAVFYQIYPRSFALGDPVGRRQRMGTGAFARFDRLRDGAGDLEGIRQRLDYLARLGIDAIWISPFQPSPMVDFGYDVSDFCGVDPLFGTLYDFDRLVADAHSRGLRVIVDLVPNHTSDQHPWFLDARSARNAEHRDWYVWRDGRGRGGTLPPNNWSSAFGKGPAWTLDETTRQWYLHLFLPQQPDLDWSNPQVVEAMTGVVRHWLDRGVDGFRVDVVHGLGKDPALADLPAERAEQPFCEQNDHPSTHAILRDLRHVIDGYGGHRVFVGEVFLPTTEQIATYYGHGDELHMAFNFPVMACGFDAACISSATERATRVLGRANAWPAWVLSNHDQPRLRTRYGGSERRARAAAVLLLGWRGTPFLFAGEELGLEDAAVPSGQAVDPGGRDGCRAPIPWDASPDHGWRLEGAQPWLPWPPQAGRRNAEALSDDPSSILHLYRRLLASRRASPALTLGETELKASPDSVVAFSRVRDGDARVVLIAFGDEECTMDLEPPADGRWVVEVASGGEGGLATEGDDYLGRLGPEEALILKPRYRARAPGRASGTTAPRARELHARQKTATPFPP